MNTVNEELHGELLDITGKLIRVCQENEIPCYLTWGSCLGAVRHRNIIPWDDDIDVCIPYPYLGKLKKAFENDPLYFYQDLETDPEHIVSWPKIRKNGTTSMDIPMKSLDCHWGICIDIFPLVRYHKPHPAKLDLVKIKCMAILARLPYYRKLGTHFLHKVWRVLYRILGENGRKKLFFRLLNSLEHPRGNYLLDYSDMNCPMILTVEEYGNGTEFPFGNLTARVPDAYDLYLRRAYGEHYMDIPPEDSPLRYYHSSSLVDCHKDYREYKKEQA